MNLDNRRSVKMKKACSILLAFVLLLALMPRQVAFASTEASDLSTEDIQPADSGVLLLEEQEGIGSTLVPDLSNENDRQSGNETTVTDPTAPAETGGSSIADSNEADPASPADDDALNKDNTNADQLAGSAESFDDELEPTTPITFTVTFDANGHGTAPEAVTADQDSTISEPAAPSEEGYSFTGWYKDAEAAELWDFSVDKVTGNITLFAGWSEDAPAVMLGAAGAKSAGSYYIKYIDDSTLRPGDQDFSNWPANGYADSGTVISLPEFTSGSITSGPDSGHIFTWNWYAVQRTLLGSPVGDNLLNESNGTFVMPESNVVVYGRWEYGECVYVKLHDIGGGFSQGSGSASNYAKNSYAIVTADPANGWGFVGWRESENGPIVSTENPWRFQVTHDMDLYAVYSDSFHVTVLGGRADKTTAAPGETVTLVAFAPPGGDEWTHWVFDKWVIEPASTQIADENASTTTFTMPGGNVTATATYAKACYIWCGGISFNPAEGYATGGGEYKVGDTVILRAYDRPGYRFTGWEASGEYVTHSYNYTFTAERDRYYDAIYEKIPTVTVQESDGGTGTADREYADAGQTVTLTATARGGYVFDHWEMVSGGVDLASPGSAQTTFVSNGNDVVVKPHFNELSVVIPIKYITVQESEGGTGTADPTFSSYIGEEITLTATPSDEYVFDYWEVISGGVDLADPSSAETTFVTNGNDVIVKPHFSRKDTVEYSITYNNLKGAFNSNTATYTTADTPIQLTDLLNQPGFTFGGWYDNADFSGSAVTEIPEGSTGDKEFFAKWTAVSYSITVVGGTADKTTATAGETVTITADNPEEGMCWVQWDLTDGINFAQSDAATTTFTMPARPVTVHAVFKGIILKQLDDQTYTGEAFEPKFGLFGVSLDGVGGIYQEGTDYDITYANNINAGTATVTVTFKGHWIGHKSTTFTIKPAYVYPDIEIECENQVYTGEELSPIATVTWKGKTLVNGIDYNLICPNWAEDNAIHVGKVSVAVRGIGNFEGDAVVYFYITPRPVTITVDNASKTSGEVDPAFTGTVVGLVNENDLGEITYSRTNTDETVGTYQGVLTAAYTANPDYIVTVVNGDFTIIQAHTVTYIVVNGTWADGSTTPKTEEVEDGQSPSQIPTGMIAAENYEGGSWNPNPTGATITDTASFTYTFKAKQNPPTPVTKHTVTYIVVNGTWADGTTTPKTEEVKDGQSPSQIPTGMLPAENYEGGAWNPNPNGATISDTASFTYTFKAKQNPPTSVTVTGIKLDSDSAKKIYTEGDALDVSGLTLEVSKSDGSKETVNVTAAMVNGFDSSKTGKQTLTVTYEGFTDTYEVEVKAKTDPPSPTYEASVQSVTWQKGSDKTLDLTIKRSEDDSLTFGKFASLKIDGKTVEARYYTTAAGSLKLSVKPEYLGTLSVGDHDVKVNFDDGSATVKLTVKAAASNPDTGANITSPKTGDESNLALWSCIMFLSLAGMIVLLLYTRKRKPEK